MDRCRSDALPESVARSLADAVIRISSLVLEAVAAMHESGCGHGALDSRTVRVVPDGSVRLAEWGPVADQIKAAGVTVTALNARGRRELLRTTRRLRELVREHRIDTVFSFPFPGRAFVETNYIANLQRQFGKELVTAIIGTDWKRAMFSKERCGLLELEEGGERERNDGPLP